MVSTWKVKECSPPTAQWQDFKCDNYHYWNEHLIKNPPLTTASAVLLIKIAPPRFKEDGNREQTVPGQHGGGLGLARDQSDGKKPCSRKMSHSRESGKEREREKGRMKAEEGEGLSVRMNEMILPSVIETKGDFKLFSTSPPHTHTHVHTQK